MNIFRYLKNKFGKKKRPLYNIHHPDFENNVEFAFESGGVNYYRAIKDFMLPVGRYKWVDASLNEVDIRMDLKVLKAYIEELKKALNGSTGIIKLDKAFQIIYSMETRCNLGFEPETVKRLASVVYFDETEDLTDYDMDYGKIKIAHWEKHETYAFFLTRPIGELLKLNDFSETSLKKYIQVASQIIEDLTSEPENLSSVNT